MATNISHGPQSACAEDIRARASTLGMIYSSIIILLMITLLSACRNTTRGNGDQLENIHWRLVEVAGRAAITDSSAREAFIMFDSTKKSAGGLSGCNRFGGSYVREGEKLTITQIIATKMACLGEGVMEQEMAFFMALERTARWEVSGDKLKLYDSTGTTVAQFERGAP